MWELKRRVERQEYAIDPQAVAEAFLARQRRCSKPATARSPVLSLILRPDLRVLLTSPTWCSGSDGGPQAHSS